MLFLAVGWLLLALAIAAVVHDALAWWTEGSFHLLGLGDLWSHLDMRSLSDAQSAVQRHVSTALWNWIVRPILLIPALPTFLALGLIFLWLGNRTGCRARGRTDRGPGRPAAPGSSGRAGRSSSTAPLDRWRCTALCASPSERMSRCDHRSPRPSRWNDPSVHQASPSCTIAATAMASSSHPNPRNTTIDPPNGRLAP